MYIDDISVQLQVFLHCIGFGFILGLVYDIFRLIRVLVIKNSRAIPAQDIAYFLLAGIITFMFLLVINNGKLRFNVLVALLLGFFTYYFTLGRFMLGAVVKTVRCMQSATAAFARIITAPYRFFVSLFGKICKKRSEKFKNIAILRKKDRKTLENKE